MTNTYETIKNLIARCSKPSELDRIMEEYIDDEIQERLIDEFEEEYKKFIATDIKDLPEIRVDGRRILDPGNYRIFAFKNSLVLKVEYVVRGYMENNKVTFTPSKNKYYKSYHVCLKNSVRYKFNIGY